MLNTVVQEPSLAKGFKALQDAGMCFDLEAEYGTALRSTNNIEERDVQFTQKFNRDFATADMLKTALHTTWVFRHLDKQPQFKKNEPIPRRAIELWQSRFRLVKEKFGLAVDYGYADPPSGFFTMSNEALDAMHASANSMKMAFHLETLRYKLSRGGIHGWPTHFSDSITKLRTDSGAQLTTGFEIIFENVTLPYFQRLSDYISFCCEKRFRELIRRLRKYAQELAQNDLSTEAITEQIIDDKEAIAKLCKKEATLRVISRLKFVIGNSAGFFEDIIKIRLESLSKRPFEMAEYAINNYDGKPLSAEQPLYMAHEILSKAS